MITEPELLNERLERLALVLDGIMPNAANLVRDALELLEERPELVRCKDCRYLNEDTGVCIVGIPHGYKDTWFCAFGKRRESDA